MIDREDKKKKIDHDQLNLFAGPSTRPSSNSSSNESSSSLGPLPQQLRPQEFSEFIGWEELSANFPFLKKFSVPGLILWGPPGSGKTSLAHLLAKQTGRELFSFNAVLGNLTLLRNWIQSAIQVKKFQQKESILLVDEIHRFNRIQQDALLPYLESGDFLFIGATTENPHYTLTKPLLSRLHVIELKKLSDVDLRDLLERSTTRLQIDLPLQVKETIAEMSNGDARKALNALDVSLALQRDGYNPQDLIKKLIQNNARDYDRSDDRHYDVISAFIKSLRGSDPHCALLWLAVMLDGGEDPLFIARRLIIFASEDVGNADPMALLMATSALTALQHIGMPEGRITLGQVVTYLASTVKSHASYQAINEAMDFVSSQKTIEVPLPLRSRPVSPSQSQSQSYLYPHDYPEHFVRQNYAPFRVPRFYRPTEFGREKLLKERLQNLWGHP